MMYDVWTQRAAFHRILIIVILSIAKDLST